MLQFQDDSFYYLKLNEKKFLFKDYEEATDRVKSIVNQEELGNLDDGAIELCRVTIGEQWQIQEISWLDFALELMKE